jgi:hypothetical protein
MITNVQAVNMQKSEGNVPPLSAKSFFKTADVYSSPSAPKSNKMEKRVVLLNGFLLIP